MSEAIKEEEIPGDAPTYEQQQLIEWEEETHRKSIDVMMDALKQLITLTAAIIGGTAVLYGQIPVAPIIKGIFSLLLLSVLGLALWGAYPITATTVYIEDIKRVLDDGITRRSRLLLWAYILLFAAFSILACRWNREHYHPLLSLLLYRLHLRQWQ